jgi:hypothetical protein
MKHLVYGRRLVVTGLSLASGLAMATGGSICNDVYASLAGAVGPSYLSTFQMQQQYAPQCLGTSSVAAPTQEIIATSFTQLSAISQGLGSRLLGGGGATKTASLGNGTGLAAGSSAGAWNAWASYSGDTAGYKVGRVVVSGVVGTPGGAAGSPFNIDNINNTSNFIVGGDYRLAPSMVLGISAASDTGTGYVNPDASAAANRTNTSSRGQALAAYVGWQVDKNWAIDASVGGGIGVSNPAPLTTADSTRRFAGVNISYANWIGNWQLNGKAGYQIGSEQFENARRGVTLPFTSYTAHLGQAKVGGEVGYWMADGVMPYVGVTYINDVSRNRVRVTQLWDDDGVVLSAGINFFSVKNNLSGGIVYTDETSRNFVRHSNWMANINYRF